MSSWLVATCTAVAVVAGIELISLVVVVVLDLSLLEERLILLNEYCSRSFGSFSFVGCSMTRMTLLCWRTLLLLLSRT